MNDAIDSIKDHKEVNCYLKDSLFSLFPSGIGLFVHLLYNPVVASMSRLLGLFASPRQVDLITSVSQYVL